MERATLRKRLNMALVGLLIILSACGQVEGDKQVIVVQGPSAADAARDGYVGSESCESCHSSIFQNWTQSGLKAIINQWDDPQGPGIVADSDGDGISDFVTGVVLGDTSVVVGDTLYSQSAAFKPMFDAGIEPRLGFDAVMGLPTVTIGPNTYEVSFTLGGKWKQLYLTIIGNSYYILPVQYNPGPNNWTVFSGTDWYTMSGNTVTGVVYGAGDTPVNQGTTETSWQQQCAGCHVTGLISIQANADGEAVLDFVERGIGCEACHGPSKEHLDLAGKGPLINSPSLSDEAAANICARCHTRGTSMFNLAGQPLGWPWPQDGSTPRIFDPLDQQLVETTDPEHRWDDVASTVKINYLQSPEFKSSHLFEGGVRCEDCHDPHGSVWPTGLRQSADSNALCLSCHDGVGPGPVPPDFAFIGGRVSDVSGHTHHPVDPANKTRPLYKGSGSECIGCHMPYTAASAENYDIRSHHFRVAWPEETRLMLNSGRGVRPNSCMTGICHTPDDLSTTDWDPSVELDLFTATLGSINSWWMNARPVASGKDSDTDVTLGAGDSVTFTLDGTRSFDPNAAAIGIFRWRQLSGPQTLIGAPVNSSTVSLKATMPGDFLFELRVTDPSSNQDYDYVEVKVSQ